MTKFENNGIAQQPRCCTNTLLAVVKMSRGRVRISFGKKILLVRYPVFTWAGIWNTAARLDEALN
jgi:hypothetical protein